jgi:hypothetical protein
VLGCGGAGGRCRSGPETCCGSDIEGFLKTPKTYLVAVRASHLVGERGIVSQLRAKHFTAEQL